MFRYHKIRNCISASIVLILLLTTYYLCARVSILNDKDTHLVYALIFMGVGMLFTIVLPATSITTERESRSWPVLLATPLDDKDILLGKFVGALRRCLPAWLLLFGHIIAFSLAILPAMPRPRPPFNETFTCHEADGIERAPIAAFPLPPLLPV